MTKQSNKQGVLDYNYNVHLLQFNIRDFTFTGRRPYLHNSKPGCYLTRHFEGVQGNMHWIFDAYCRQWLQENHKDFTPPMKVTMYKHFRFSKSCHLTFSGHKCVSEDTLQFQVVHYPGNQSFHISLTHVLRRPRPSLTAWKVQRFRQKRGYGYGCNWSQRVTHALPAKLFISTG